MGGSDLRVQSEASLRQRVQTWPWLCAALLLSPHCRARANDWPTAMHCPCSTNVGPRRYLGKDEVMDYEVMSDQEWEDEGDGERQQPASQPGDGGSRGRMGGKEQEDGYTGVGKCSSAWGRGWEHRCMVHHSSFLCRPIRVR